MGHEIKQNKEKKDPTDMDVWKKDETGWEGEL